MENKFNKIIENQKEGKDQVEIKMDYDGFTFYVYPANGNCERFSEIKKSAKLKETTMDGSVNEIDEYGYTKWVKARILSTRVSFQPNKTTGEANETSIKRLPLVIKELKRIFPNAIYIKTAVPTDCKNLVPREMTELVNNI